MATNGLGSRVDREVLVHVEHLFRNAATRLRTQLLNRCGRDVPVRVASVDTARIGEVFERSKGVGSATSSIRVTPSDLQGFVLMDYPLAHRLIGMMLGDDGKCADSRPNRTMTRFDLKMVGAVAGDVIASVIEAVTMPGTVNACVENVVANPRAALTLPRSTAMIEVTLDFGPAASPFGLVSVLLPQYATGVLWPDRDLRRPREPDQTSMGRVMPLRVDVVAELARTTLNLGDVRKLVPGSLIELGPVGEVTVRIRGRAALLAQPGERDGVRSVKIVRRLEAAA